jgi:hypothetical protein
MARVPLFLRPSIYVRRTAIRRGLFGPSTFWRVVAVGVLGKGVLRRLLGTGPDYLGRRRLGVGHAMSIAVVAPMTRKERKRTGVTRAGLERAARADLEAARRAS